MSIGYCSGCSKKEDPGKLFQLCSQCKNTKYCCRKCHKKHWKIHKTSCDSKSKTFMCETCGKGFSAQFNLNKYVKKCQKCEKRNKTFTNESKYEKHVMNNCYVCRKCSKKIDRVSKYKHHINNYEIYQI